MPDTYTLRSNGNNTDDDGDGLPAAPDPTNAMEEIQLGEYPRYFSERAGRLFAADDPAYPLPVDTPEAERLDLCHRVIKRYMGANFVGPVREMLGNGQGPPKIVLDLGTAKGKWVLEMADEFPQVYFRGIDIVPIATHYPPPNVRFEVHDLRQQTRWDNDTFDVVHARSVDLTVEQYSTIINESARVLRPGGLFISCEWGLEVRFHPRYAGPQRHALASMTFFNTVKAMLTSRRGTIPIPTEIPTMLTASQRFAHITPDIHLIPIGEWSQDSALRAIGKEHREALEKLADSFEQFFRESGLTEQDIDMVIGNFKRELGTQGLVGVLYTVHARKV